MNGIPERVPYMKDSEVVYLEEEGKAHKIKHPEYGVLYSQGRRIKSNMANLEGFDVLQRIFGVSKDELKRETDKKKNQARLYFDVDNGYASGKVELLENTYRNIYGNSVFVDLELNGEKRDFLRGFKECIMDSEFIDNLRLELRINDEHFVYTGENVGQLEAYLDRFM